MDIYAERVGEKVVFEAPAIYKDIFRSIPGCLYSSTGKNWTAPLSQGTCLAAYSLLKERLKFGPELIAWGRECRAWENTIAAVKLDQGARWENRDAYHFQGIGGEFLTRVERGILADEMGLGKTIQAILGLYGLKDGLPALVICTNTMKWKWQEEFNKWAPHLRIQVINGSAAKRREQLAVSADCYIINWEALRIHSRLAPYGSIALTETEREPKELNGLPLRTVILDEAHKLKDPKAKQTRAAWAVAHEASYRFALTGTPIANSPEDIWSIGHCIAPEEYPSKTAFINRYTRNSLNFWGGLEVQGFRPETRAEFDSFFVPRFFRRTKAEVLTELPDKIYTERRIEASTKQRRIYDSLRKDFIAGIGDNILVAGSPLTLLTRLLQAACAVPVLDGEGNVCEFSTPSCKVDALRDILEEASGDPIVVFAPSRKLIELCSRELSKDKVAHGLITGHVSTEERVQVVRDFQAGVLQAVLATTGAGGEGITLTRASRLVFLQRPWSSVQSVQAEDRIHRIGQQNAVEIIDVITCGTIESAISDRLGWKSEKLRELVSANPTDYI